MAEKIIALACAVGLSTSLLVSKMEKAAASENKNYKIFAKSTAELEEILKGEEKPDVLLLGPQVAFMQKEVEAKAAAEGVAFGVIDKNDYAMIRGDKILAAAEKLMK